MSNLKETVEALIFASGEPLSKKDLTDHIPELTARELNKIIEELKSKYGGDSGIVLATFNDKMQFTSNPKYGGTLADVLTPIREKALSDSLLEVLSIIAYKQPVTRMEIEEIKGRDPDYALSVLMRVNLIEVKGRKDAVGRPILFGTTDEFLRKFGLENVGGLPDYKEVLERISLLDENFNNGARDTLYFDRKLGEQPDFIVAGGDVTYSEVAADMMKSSEIDRDNDVADDDEDNDDLDEIPDFLKDEDIKEYK